MLGRTKFADREFSLGPFPLERLPRSKTVYQREITGPTLGAALGAAPSSRRSETPLGRSINEYIAILTPFLEGDAAPKGAVSDDLDVRTRDVKGASYFLDAAGVGICRMPDAAWIGDAAPGHHFAIVFLVEHGRAPEAGNLAHDWIKDAVVEGGDLHALEIAAVVSGHVRQLGFAATGHVPSAGQVDLERLAVLAGLCFRQPDGLHHPFIGKRFSVGAITTAYELNLDAPLRPSALSAFRLGYWLGWHGGVSGRERARQAARPSDASKYPMETVKRVEKTTTLIIDEEVPRIPKRAAMFDRALRGDLGEKTLKERSRFAVKNPFGAGLMGPIAALHKHQDGDASDVDTSLYADAAANARAIKSLSYFLGADLTGICEIPNYAWYSHRGDGSEIEPRHKYAVVMLIDQGFDTMEGASGDDWISGSQSMRGYLRGAEIAGVMARHLRRLGFSSRPQTNTDSEVLQIPLVLLAGLGELSRIGELVLNPFVGPRFKSVVLTTDMPLLVDKPIDFGLQYFCEHCRKCARECPCDAIPWGDKIMFNGYEIWKPDVERCARYRLTNRKGSACGRCMKTCPLNKVVTIDGPLVTRLASWCGIHLLWAKPIMAPIAAWLDDALGHGRRVMSKKWWMDLEVVDGICVEPFGANERELDIDKVIKPENQKMATIPASLNPPPDELAPWPIDRKAALKATKWMETPAQAKLRIRSGGPAPEHYVPTPAKAARRDAE